MEDWGSGGPGGPMPLGLSLLDKEARSGRKLPRSQPGVNVPASLALGNLQLLALCPAAPGPFLLRTIAPTPAAKSAPMTRHHRRSGRSPSRAVCPPGWCVAGGCGRSWQEGHPEVSSPLPSAPVWPSRLAARPRAPRTPAQLPALAGAVRRAQGGLAVAAVLADKPRSCLRFPMSNPPQGPVQTPSRAPLSGFRPSRCRSFCELRPQMLVPSHHCPIPPSAGGPGPSRCPVLVFRRGEGQGCLTRSRSPSSQQGLGRECVQTVWGRRPGAPLQFRGHHAVACGSVAPPGAEWAPVPAAYLVVLNLPNAPAL